MNFYQAQFCSDPLEGAARDSWHRTQDWLASVGWYFDNDKGRLTLDPTGGRQAIGRLKAVLSSCDTDQNPSRGWWSMSDTSLILNALGTKGRHRLFHGHPLSLVGRNATTQQERFLQWSRAFAHEEPFPEQLVPTIVVLRGQIPARSVVWGGNLGAMERLVETGWRFPSRHHLILLESLSAPARGLVERIQTFLKRVDLSWAEGILLGRFSTADREQPFWWQRAVEDLRPDLPIARWPLVGHGADAWTIPLGEEIPFRGDDLAKAGAIL